MKNKLLDTKELERSTIVANNRMNRERNVLGINSYEKDIYFNPVDFLEERRNRNCTKWLDLCCGQGKALIQSAELFKERGLSSQIELEGVDLVDYFYESNPALNLTLKVQNLEKWIPDKEYDLITIVHGLHYIGDKIELIKRSLSALKPDGLFIANLDVDNIKLLDTHKSKRVVLDFLKENKIEYNSRKKIIKTTGKKKLKSDFRYLGADDKAGRNYTGQEVVNSYYEN